MDTKEYGKGYSVQNLKYMSQIANEFSYDEISQQAVGQIPWGTIIAIMQNLEEIRLQPATQIPWWTLIQIISKSKSHEEMLYYINETHKNGC